MSTTSSTRTTALSRGDQQRALIISAVTDLLAEVPITKLSVSRIAEHAGVTRPVFYFYFESKYVVVAAALREVWTEFDDLRREITPDDLAGPPEEIMRRALADGLKVWRRHAPLLIACSQARSSDPQLAEMWATFVGDTADQVTSLIIALRDQGLMAPASTDVPAVVEALLGMTVWTLLDESTRPADRPSTERMAEAIGAIWRATLWGTR